MVEIVWTENALSDLHEIYHYISKDSVRYADDVLNRLFDRIEILVDFPQIGRMVPEYNNPDFKELIEGNYRIIYELQSDDRILVLKIHHSARPWLL